MIHASLKNDWIGGAILESMSAKDEGGQFLIVRTEVLSHHKHQSVSTHADIEVALQDHSTQKLASRLKADQILQRTKSQRGRRLGFRRLIREEGCLCKI